MIGLNLLETWLLIHSNSKCIVDVNVKVLNVIKLFVENMVLGKDYFRHKKH